MDQFKTQKNLINYASIVSAVSFLIVIVVAVLVLWPKFQELQTVQGNIEREKAEVQLKEEYVLMLDDVMADLESNREGVSKIKTALPASPSVPSLFNYLQRTASGSGLILTEISPFTVSLSGTLTDLRETVFTIKASGSYSSFKNFISTLEKSARLIEVESISLSSNPEELFSFNLKLKTFSY
jgi:Tfp pilus assembly protein PilO